MRENRDDPIIIAIPATPCAAHMHSHSIGPCVLAADVLEDPGGAAHPCFCKMGLLTHPPKTAYPARSMHHTRNCLLPFAQLVLWYQRPEGGRNGGLRQLPSREVLSGPYLPKCACARREAGGGIIRCARMSVLKRPSARDRPKSHRAARQGRQRQRLRSVWRRKHPLKAVSARCAHVCISLPRSMRSDVNCVSTYFWKTANP